MLRSFKIERPKANSQKVIVMMIAYAFTILPRDGNKSLFARIIFSFVSGLKNPNTRFLKDAKSAVIKQHATIATTIETSVVGIRFAVFQIPRSGVERIEKSKSFDADGVSEDELNNVATSLELLPTCDRGEEEDDYDDEEDDEEEKWDVSASAAAGGLFFGLMAGRNEEKKSSS